MSRRLNNIITYQDHAVDVLAQAAAYVRAGQLFVLITSVDIKGGSARDVGSLAVVADTGEMTGYMSNGCIDRDIVLQGLTTIETGQIKHIRYGAGSPYMDLKLPCGGALELVIDPAPNFEMLLGALKDLRARKLAVLTFAAQSGSVRFQYAPKPALVLAGRGAILRTTASLAAHMDFGLHIASPDSDDLTNLVQLEPITCQPMTTPQAFLQIPVDAHTAVLLLFHDHEWEQSLLMRAAAQGPFFIGALGSRKTQDIRLQRLADAGLSPALCARIQGPIGLVPSLRNASLIAVSALAEVTANLPAAQVRLV